MQATNVIEDQSPRESFRISNFLKSRGEMRRLSHDYNKIWKARIKRKGVEVNI
jgi:hypothetical protein